MTADGGTPAADPVGLVALIPPRKKLGSSSKPVDWRRWKVFIGAVGWCRRSCTRVSMAILPGTFGLGFVLWHRAVVCKGLVFPGGFWNVSL